MDSNTHSTRQWARHRSRAVRWRLAVDGLAGQELDRLADAVLAERVLVLRRLLDRLEGQWLQQLAGRRRPGRRRG